MGRPPTPTSLKLVKGNPGKRALSKGEPDPEYQDNLEPPAHLPERAQVVWREIAGNLRQARLFAKIDSIALELTCVAIANYRLAAHRAGDDLMRVSGENNQENMSPWLMVQSMSFKQAMIGMAKFGMSPADRTRLLVQPQGGLFDDNPGKADKFFK